MEKYINYATCGNGKVTATFSKQGELLRLFYPNCDYKQFVEALHIGVKVNDSAIIYLHDDINNMYMQNYIKNTNILQTEILNTYFNLKILQTDFVPINENLLVRNYVLKNESDINLKVNLLAYSSILTNVNNDTCGYVKDDALIQYNHDYTICLFSKNKLLSYQVNGAKNSIGRGVIYGKDYVGLSSDSAISYDFEELKPGEKVEFTIFLLVNDNNIRNLLGEMDSEIERVRKLDYEFLFNECKNYWEDFVKSHDKLKLKNSKLSDKIKNIYTRTILLYPLLQNREKGGISAGMEVDEGKTKCGRYSYCWPRDAVFITRALDILGMTDETTKFYSKFCKSTQSKNGMWEQRFYTDGRLAPSWGYQIDETASVIIGLYDHYLKIKDIDFLKSNLRMCEKAIEFLKKYIDDILEQKNEMKLSYDLWEEHEGISIYSISAIFSAMTDMIKIDKIVKKIFTDNPSKLENILKRDEILNSYLERIKEYICNSFFDEQKQTFIRNTDDRRIDISILGISIPFEVLDVNDEKVVNTVEKMNMTIRTYTGGYIRYEGDGYMGGYNPWPIATLWMALYYIEANELNKAKECFDFVVNSCTEHGFLGEQVDNNSMSAMWVIGLAWSHAMFIIVLEKLAKKGCLNEN
ncbi:MAG: hypothetical protein HFJ45_03050 [Clostridia bacterium]|nr:hypothetical protein [Clostridia bacterium]